MSDAVRYAVAELAGDLRAWLEYAEETGAEYLPWEPPRPRQQAVQTHTQRAPHERPQRAPQTQSHAQPPRPPQDRPKSGALPGQPSARPSTQRRPSQGAALDGLRETLGSCPWREGDQHTGSGVFGVGNPEAELMFIGGAPGRDELLTQEPFVGRAGQLLTRMLHAIGLQREDTYLTYVLKWQGPEGREPREDELAPLLSLLSAQIRAVSPKVIVTSGPLAAQHLVAHEGGPRTGSDTVSEIEGIPCVAMAHPEALLEDPALKGAAYDDLLLVKSLLRAP